MSEQFLTIIFIFFCLLVGLFLTVKMILPREVWTQVFAEIINQALRGLWRLLVAIYKLYLKRREILSKLLEKLKNYK